MYVSIHICISCERAVPPGSLSVCMYLSLYTYNIHTCISCERAVPPGSLCMYVPIYMYICIYIHVCMYVLPHNREKPAACHQPGGVDNGSNRPSNRPSKSSTFLSCRPARPSVRHGSRGAGGKRDIYSLRTSASGSHRTPPSSHRTCQKQGQRGWRLWRMGRAGEFPRAVECLGGCERRAVERRRESGSARAAPARTRAPP
jgi:hypothetical protein